MVCVPEVFAPAVRGVLATLPSKWRHFVCYLLRFQLRLVRLVKAFFLRCRLFWLGILVRMRSLVFVEAYAALPAQDLSGWGNAYLDTIRTVAASALRVPTPLKKGNATTA